MCPQTTTFAVTPSSSAATASSGVRGQDPRVGRRRRMAEHDGADVRHLELDGRRPLRDPTESGSAESRRAPARALDDGWIGSGRVGRLPVAVAHEEPNPLALGLQPLGPPPAAPGDEVSAGDDRVGRLAARIGEDGFERRKVAVDVVEGGDCASPRRRPALGAAARPAPSPGPAGADAVERRAARAGAAAASAGSRPPGSARRRRELCPRARPRRHA